MLKEEELIQYAAEVIEYAMYIIHENYKTEEDDEEYLEETPNEELVEEELSEEEREEEEKTILHLKENSKLLSETKNKIICIFNNTLATCDIIPIEEACSKCKLCSELKTPEEKEYCINKNKRIARAVGFEHVICMNQLKNRIIWGYHPEVYELTNNVLDQIVN